MEVDRHSTLVWMVINVWRCASCRVRSPTQAILPHRQVVRHMTLTHVFGGSNPPGAVALCRNAKSLSYMINQNPKHNTTRSVPTPSVWFFIKGKKYDFL